MGCSVPENGMQPSLSRKELHMLYLPDKDDNLSDFERSDTKHNLPLGWLVLYVGLIVWGAYYSLAYTPQTGNWSQEGQYLESLKQK